jgi:hypothetical protein
MARSGFFFEFGSHFTLHGRKPSCIPGFIAGFQMLCGRGGVVFSKLAWVALISLVGPASVFCQDAPRDVSDADTTTSKPKALQVGANVEAAQLIRQVAPVYPPIAKTAKHFRNRRATCHYREGRNGRGSAICERVSTFAEIRDGCSQAVAIQADAAYGRAGSCGHGDLRCVRIGREKSGQRRGI